MRIISLNIWGGRAGKDKLLAFLKEQAPTTDIFCLQEVWSKAHYDLAGKPAGGVQLDYSKIMTNGVHDISEILDDFVPYFRPHVADNYGLLMFVHEKHAVLNEGELFVYKNRGYVSDEDAGNHARNIQFITLKQGPLTVINFHGLWNGNGKGDSEDRLLQSEKIINFISTLKNPFVLCGDFNLMPNTESLKKFETAGYKNLVQEYGITSTRTSLYQKPIKFADYAFVSKDLTIKQFKVLPDEVSDHSPLYVEISV